MHPTLLTCLPVEYIHLYIRYQENDYIFMNDDGSLHHPDYPSKLFRKVIQGIPEPPQNITLHGLRKFCVSILIHEGKDVVSVQNWVGHKDISTTLKIYSKVKERLSQKEKEADLFNREHTSRKSKTIERTSI